MEYYVTYSVHSRFIAKVDAENIEEAKEKADMKFAEADFGAALDTDGDAIIVEDSNGNRVWEKE